MAEGGIRRGVKRLFRLAPRGPAELRDQIGDEVRAHLEARAEQLVRRGLAPSDARAEALRRFGALSFDEARDRLYDSARRREERVRHRERLDMLRQDVRFALRTFRRRPGFVAAVIGTFALGLGASTAMFSLVDATLLRALPFLAPERLVVLWGVAGPERDIRGASIPEVADWRAMNHALAEVSAYDPTSLNLRTREGAERVRTEMVSASYFPLLGVRAARGRTFGAEEDRSADANPVVVVSHDFWQTRFAGDPSLVGRAITLNDRPLTVIGIMPEGFRGLSFDAELWIPVSMVSLTASPDLFTARGTRWLMAIGRLRDGVTIAGAQRDLDAVAARLAEEHPDVNRDRGVRLMSLEENYLGATRAMLLTLLAAVLLFLLITCANVTSLQLVRATARRGEIAVRLALGAGRRRLVRQLLTEGLILSLLGGAAGVALAYWSVAALVPLVPAGLLPSYARLAVDVRVLLFALVLTVLCGLVCGLAPALLASRQSLATALNESARAASPGIGRIRRPGVQQMLVAGEVALALVLLIGAGLMLRSLARQFAVPTGIRAEGVLAARVSLPAARYDPAATAAFAERLLERLRAVPSVAEAAVGSDLPFTNNSSAANLVIDGGDPEPIRYYRHRVSPTYFRTLGIPIIRGRGFGALDRADSPPVAIVSDAMARRFWPGTDPIGRRLRLGAAPGNEAVIVGVAATARFRDLTTDLAAPGSEPDVYFPLAQRPDRDLEIAVRSRTGALPSAALLKRELAAIDPSLPVFAVQPLSDVVAAQSATARFGSVVLAVFSTAALLLAAIGIYGVIAFVVGMSRREIAIRMALGAEPRAVLALVVRNGVLLAGLGIVIGLAGAAMGTRALSGQLFGVSATDPATFAAVATAVLIVALAASWLPARRAAGIDPQSALRAE